MTTLHGKMNLMKGLVTKELAYTGPFFVSLDLTRRCNLNCLYCRYHSPISSFPSPIDKPVSDFPLDMLNKLFGELKEMKTEELIFAGEGEPFLYPHFLDAVSAAKAAGMHLNVITNGTLLTEEIIRKLIDMRLDLLTVSMWASSEEEYKKLYPGTKPHFFKKILDAINLVTDIKAKENSQLPQLRLHRPISRDNFRTMEMAFDQAHSAGCDHLTFAPIHSLKGEESSYMLSHQEEREVISSLRRIKRRLDENKMKHNIDVVLQLYRIGEAVWEKLPCYVGWVHSRVRINGSVFSCGRCDLPMGNLSEMSFQKIWNGQAYRSFRKRVSTRKGLAEMREHCLCAYCCHIRNNIKTHKIFKWFSPLTAALRHS